MTFTVAFLIYPQIHFTAVPFRQRCYHIGSSLTAAQDILHVVNEMSAAPGRCEGKLQTKGVWALLSAGVSLDSPYLSFLFERVELGCAQAWREGAVMETETR